MITNATTAHRDIAHHNAYAIMLVTAKQHELSLVLGRRSMREDIRPWVDDSKSSVLICKEMEEIRSVEISLGNRQDCALQCTGQQRNVLARSPVPIVP